MSDEKQGLSRREFLASAGMLATTAAIAGGSVLSMGIPGVAMAGETVELIVNGKKVTGPVPANLVNGTVVAPVRPVAEALGATVAWDGATRTLTVAGAQPGQAALPPLPWPYKRLDPEVVRRKGYEECSRINNCMYGGAAGLILALREAVGYPWTALPELMFVYGAGGVAGLGTTCGALNGAAAVISLLSDPNTGPPACFGPITELFEWYCTTKLPTDKHEAYCKVKNQPATKAYSPLCSFSLWHWFVASGQPMWSDAQKDRCAKVVGDTAARAAEILNARLG
ncbi:MAG: C-GCAxxG-C-C family (seleno)protein [Clostridia bacterium]|nr:C-GCAxxG-C-C family protein [Clostridia bacterium]MDH7573107.1 C-GCAxxG-C-C family (seleno)protein [Clostridia bacterium]